MKPSFARPYLSLAAAVAILAGTSCASPTATVQTPAGASTPAAPAAPTAPSASTRPQAPHAAYKPVTDPSKAAQTVKIKEYWDFDKNSPMEVEDYEAKYGADRDKDGKAEVTLTAQVKLPTPKTMAILQADEEQAEETEPEPEEEATEEAVEDPDEPEQVASEDAGEEEEDVTVLDEDGDEDWDEDDDGYTDLYEDEAEDDAQEEYTEEEEQALLSGPHKVTLDAEDAPFMSEEEDTVWVTDETTGNEFMISYDQEWTQFSIENDGGELKVVLNPDGTYTIDNQPAATTEAAIALLRDSEVVKASSKHAIAFLSARLGRLPSQASRSAGACWQTQVDGPCGPPPRYHVSSAGTPQSQRAHALTEGLLKQLVSNP